MFAGRMRRREQELDELLDRLVGLREGWEKLIAEQIEDINSRWSAQHPRSFEQRLEAIEKVLARELRR